MNKLRLITGVFSFNPNLPGFTNLSRYMDSSEPSDNYRVPDGVSIGHVHPKVSCLDRAP